MKNSAKKFVERYLKASTIIIITLTAANFLLLLSVIGVDFEFVSRGIPLLITTTDQVHKLNENGQTDAGWRTVRMRVSAYCPCPKCCGKHSDGVTASSHRIGRGDMFVAADKKYDFKTRFIIPGYNGSRPVEVLDRGGAIRGNRLDVFFDSHKKARQWGLKYMDVKVRQ